MRILFDLSAVQHALQPARFLGKFEQALPLVFREKRLFERSAAGVLRLALRLPGGNLLLFTSKRSLVVLEVVILGVVSFDSVQEQIAVLLQKWVYAQRQVVKVGSEDI